MRERSGKVLIALVLMIVGALLLLDQFGIDGEEIIETLIPVAIMAYGVRKICFFHTTGSRVWGMFAFLFGLLMLIGKLEMFFSSMLAIGVMYLGFRMLRRSPDETMRSEMPSPMERHWAQAVLKEDMLDSWEREHHAKKT